jgi:hypothetical protein
MGCRSRVEKSSHAGDKPSTRLWRRSHVCQSSNLPTQDDSTALKEDFLERTIRIRQELGSPVVPARPSPENCRYCQVKLLCDEFWASVPATASAVDRFRDIEALLVRQESESIWLANTYSLKADAQKLEVLIKRPSEGAAFWSELSPGTRLRLTDVMVTYGEHGESLSFQLRRSRNFAGSPRCYRNLSGCTGLKLR